ncbi:ABC transporter permease [Paenibacillus donghaensis]|uniref:ABC transporter permease n=1 Tax=Paenibacillus donghaensis TaxID=414771 RepID=A0A2Z2KDR2_9BACL|nr:ABC transporter permease [Paenibacillus donghaensis]ASA24866.1 ABC transporter permease [Paenibacillus donghaensis]
MSILIRNELLKLKRLKSVYVIFILSFLPYAINTAGLLMTNKDITAGRYYFFVFNQYAILFPTIIFTFTGFFFYTEFKNRTMLNWISYPFHTFQLIFSKMISTFILLLFLSLLNHIVLLATQWMAFGKGITFNDVGSSLLTSTLFSTLCLLIIPVAAFLVLTTKSIIGVMIAGVASIFITTILLGADISIYFPFSYIYRLSIQFYDSSFGYSTQRVKMWGALILAAYVGLSTAGLYLYSKKSRVY